jgi:uncharacterized C2H2 Zn-finger protein
MMLEVIFKCPTCGAAVRPLEFRREWREGSSFRCPHCNQLLRFSKQYVLVLWIASLPLAAVIPGLFGIRFQDNTIGFLLVTLLSWPAIRLPLLSIVARTFGPPKLEISYPKGTLELFDKRRR